ncbi:MAG: beta-galactosidase [Verrucomicrobia bacterium]|nr:beta-galactosidase [Verrucomicrobiota bacterium]
MRQIIQTGVLAATLPFLPGAFAEPREQWMREGIVTASDMRGLTFILRRGGDFADIPDKWHAQRNEETVRRLKELGVNLIIVNLQNGFGLKAEGKDIEATRAFTVLAHRHGLKVAGYVGASLMYETFFKEEPAAREWRQVDEFGRPIYYTAEQTYRYMACRNNPSYMAFVKKVIRLGIKELGMDVLHFDQVMWWPEPQSCRCSHCRQQFREFLARRYSDPARARLRFGFAGFEEVIPPPYNLPAGPPVMIAELKNPLMQEWSLFRSASLAQRWGELDRYIHQLNPHAAIIGNPMMYQEGNVGFLFGVDLGQLAEHGDGLWTEEPNLPQWTADNRLISRIRSYKAARAMGQPLFVWQNLTGNEDYQKSPQVLRLAEALAFNDANLGVVAGEDAGGNEPSEELRRYIHFFWSHLADLRHTTPVTDVGVLRTFASTQFNPSHSLFSTVLFEQTLIQSRVPFGLVFEQRLRDVSHYKALVLADQDALSDEQVAQIRRFVAQGGGLVATEDTSRLTDWRTRRNGSALADLYGSNRVVYLPRIEAAAPAPAAQMSYYIPNALWKLPHNADALLAAVKQAAGGKLSVEMEAPAWVVAELADQPATGTRLLHLINFKYQEPLRDLPVKVRLPQGARFREAVVETPDGPTQKLRVSVEGDTVSFRVPELKVYDLVLLRTER